MTRSTKEKKAADKKPPQTLEDMLKDYDKDKIRTITKAFLSCPPVGKELL